MKESSLHPPFKKILKGWKVLCWYCLPLSYPHILHHWHSKKQPVLPLGMAKWTVLLIINSIMVFFNRCPPNIHVHLLSSTDYTTRKLFQTQSILYCTNAKLSPGNMVGGKIAHVICWQCTYGFSCSRVITNSFAVTQFVSQYMMILLKNVFTHLQWTKKRTCKDTRGQPE